MVLWKILYPVYSHIILNFKLKTACYAIRDPNNSNWKKKRKKEKKNRLCCNLIVILQFISISFFNHVETHLTFVWLSMRNQTYLVFVSTFLQIKMKCKMQTLIKHNKKYRFHRKWKSTLIQSIWSLFFFFSLFQDILAAIQYHGDATWLSINSLIVNNI